MKTIKLISIALLAIMAISFTSCNKDAGFVGKGEIKGLVSYPGGVAAGAIVSVKFGAKEASTDFDYSTVADASGNYKFEALNKGDYYVDATYTDSYGNTFSTGGAHVNLKSAQSVATADFVLE